MVRRYVSVYSENLERHHNVPVHGASFPISQSVRGVPSIAYWSTKEYIQPSTIPSGSHLARLINGLQSCTHMGVSHPSHWSLHFSKSCIIAHQPIEWNSSEEWKSSAMVKKKLDKQKKMHLYTFAVPVYLWEVPALTPIILISVHTVAASSHGLIFCGHASRMDKKGATQCVCRMSYGPWSVCQSWA